MNKKHCFTHRPFPPVGTSGLLWVCKAAWINIITQNCECNWTIDSEESTIMHSAKKWSIVKWSSSKALDDDSTQPRSIQRIYPTELWWLWPLAGSEWATLEQNCEKSVTNQEVMWFICNDFDLIIFLWLIQCYHDDQSEQQVNETDKFVIRQTRNLLQNEWVRSQLLMDCARMWNRSSRVGSTDLELLLI
jgi:hypothetical protein